MKIGISADSTCDLPQEFIKKYNIKLMPMIITLDDKEYQDGIDITQDQLYEYIERTGNLAKTAARSSYEYVEHFENMLNEYDHVFHFSLSFKISSTGNNSRIAAEEIGNDKVTVIDSKSLTTGQGLLILSCAEKIAQKKDIQTIKEELEAEVEKIQASFLVGTLKYLHKGGRCSGIALLGANVLKIRPRIVVSGGKMKNDRKYRGQMSFAVKKYCEECLNENPDIDKSLAFVTYSSATPEMIEIATNALKDAGVETVYETKAGGTITSHCGENTLGILFYNDGIKTL